MRTSIRYILLLVSICITFVGCEKSSSKEDNTPEQTLIFYLAGVDLNSYFQKNIADITAALNDNILGNSRVVVLCQNGNKQSAELTEIEYKKDVGAVRTALGTYTLPTVMNETELHAIFADIIGKAPAKRYSLIIGAHGLGWLPSSMANILSAHPTAGGIMQDIWDKPENSLTRYIGDKHNTANMFDISTLATAITNAGVKMEYILFDACLMSNIESIYELRNVTKYVVASPCEILNDGFPYKEILPLMLQDKGRSYDLDAICQSFYNCYKNKIGYSGSIAAVDCSQLDALATAMKRVNNSSQKTYQLADIQFYEGQRNHVFFDLGDYVTTMSDDSQARDDFMRQLNMTVIHKYTLASFYSDYGNSGIYPIDMAAYSGVSTSAPSELYRDEYKECAWYKATN